jgi:hypothetical protein
VVQNSDFVQILAKTKICTRGLNMENHGNSPEPSLRPSVCHNRKLVRNFEKNRKKAGPFSVGTTVGQTRAVTCPLDVTGSKKVPTFYRDSIFETFETEMLGAGFH